MFIGWWLDLNMENHKGFIALVDISGYTNFVSGHNTDAAKKDKSSQGQAHAEHIISDLLEKVIEELNGILTINKLQGDAALFYAIPDDPNKFSEKIIIKLQDSFKKFNQHINDIKFCATWPCSTCPEVGDLKLKSFVHFGDFLIKKVNQFTEIAGQDVILAHRLMKNTIGVSEYMLFTKAFSDIKDISSLGSIEKREEKYEGLGAVDCSVFYPDPNLYELEISKKKSWFGNNFALLKYFIQSKTKRKIEEKYNLIGG